LAYYPDDELRAELERMITKALEWEASRVAEHGTLMDGGNTRTAGQEKTRSSVVKTVSYGSAVRAFTYWAEFTNAPEYHEIARRLNNHPVNK
jgi:allantoicase